MEELINEIKKSFPYNKEFYLSINKEEILGCIKKCKTLDHAQIFINKLLELEDNLKHKTYQELLDNKYSYDGLNEPLFKELLDCRLYIKEILSGINYNYTQPLNKEFYERLYIRIILLKEGWRPLNIENFIKTNYSLKWDIIRYKFTYIYFMSILNIKQKQQYKGRPKLPLFLKSYINPILKEKNKVRMKEKYDISKDLNKLFTKEDVTLIRNQFKDNLILLKKLDILDRYSL
jgi:hypothetical protein